MLRYVTIFVILTALGILYEKYKLKYETDPELSKYDLIEKFLLGSTTSLAGKPILWIHTTHEINARHWPSFGSRNTMRLNQPYILACIETIVKHCADSFNVCLIDDSSFGKLIPGWSIDVAGLASPLREHVRMLAMGKLLYYFGGFAIPDSTIVTADLGSVYSNALKKHCCFSANMQSRNSTATYVNFFPDHRIMGCKKGSPVMKNYMLYLERLVSRDHTAEIEFLGEVDRWLYQECKEHRMALIEGGVFGAEDAANGIITLEMLMGSSYIEFSPAMKAICIPADELLKRRSRYGWFTRLSRSQLRTCDNMIAKYLLVANN